ncbi:MAG: V-type ATP synthase subunit A [PVC group bacterium]
MLKAIGKVSRVSGPVVEAKGTGEAFMLEQVEVGPDHLVGEVVHLDGEKVIIQVYEDTTGLAPGTEVYGSGRPLSLELGPGLIGSIFDGIQRPLEVIRSRTGQYIRKGVHVPPLSRDRFWEFEPQAREGQELAAGAIIGAVRETPLIKHRILVPPGMGGRLKMVAPPGPYRLQDTVALLERAGAAAEISLLQTWPARKRRPCREKLPLTEPLLTGQRVIDTLFPVAKGGVVAVPGGFGTGKTLIQHQLAKWCDAQVIVFIGCGERGNEMTDVLLNFPRLVDPLTGRPLMERTIFVANTSNMPVAAREASIYTGITLAEYYRDMGYHVAVMADSTSRWAEALRELSGRMEEMPADEGFPAYLPTRLAEFYERAGMVTSLSGQPGSVTIIGSVSPPGGDFSEPVTQHTKRFVRAFWALDRELANARHYPAVSWTDSYSEYLKEMEAWWMKNVDPGWAELRNRMMELLQREARLQQVVKLVGPDVLPDTQRLVLETCALFKNAFLQQNAFEEIDSYSTPQKQARMLKIIVSFYDLGLAAIKRGAPLLRLRKLKAYGEIMRMKTTYPNQEAEKLDGLLEKLKTSIEKFA